MFRWPVRRRGWRCHDNQHHVTRHLARDDGREHVHRNIVDGSCRRHAVQQCAVTERRQGANRRWRPDGHRRRLRWRHQHSRLPSHRRREPGIACGFRTNHFGGSLRSECITSRFFQQLYRRAGVAEKVRNISLQLVDFLRGRAMPRRYSTDKIAAFAGKINGLVA
jgi:type II secretory pathway component PulJ